MDFLRTTVIIQWNSWKKIAVAWKKIPDPRNSQEYHQSFIGKKNTKSVKQSKIITYQPKTIENPNIVDIKYYYRTSKTSHKLFKTMRQAEKVGSNIITL